ncbi:hypothetical protein ABIA24_001796 [Sinorhizobium fredii]
MTMDWPNWEGETAVVVASGPSAADVVLELGKGRARFLAVKDAWKLCPWADHLYACDHHWWEAHRGVVEFKGRRIAYDARTVEKWRGLNFLKVEISKAHQTLRFEAVGHVGWGGNSGFHALNLALQFGAARVLLVGFDMRVDRGKHFFGPHAYTKERPSEANCAKWREILDGQAGAIAARGVEVINCSPVSALKAYRKMDFSEALNG